MTSDVNLLAKMGTDAAIWANEYEARFPDGTPDWGTLVGWFANAIEAGRGPDPDYEAAWFVWLHYNPSWMSRQLKRRLRTPIKYMVDAALGITEDTE